MFLRKPEKVLFERTDDLFTYVAGGLGYTSKKKYNTVKDAVYDKMTSAETKETYNGVNFGDEFNITNENYTDTMNNLSAVFLAQIERDKKLLFIFGGIAAVALGVGTISSYIKSKDDCDDCEGFIKIDVYDEDPTEVSLDD